MLRRATKRIKDAKIDSGLGKRTKVDNIDSDLVPLGDPDSTEKDEAELVLEKYVLGGGEEILEALEATEEKAKKKAKKKDKEAPAPVWQDEDEINIKVKVSAKGQKAHKKDKSGKEITGETYQQNLKNQFEKVTGNPTWARLKWEKSDEEKEDSDEDGSDLLQSTGNYLASSTSLPKGIIQLKACTDANKHGPAKGKLRSVEFHPSAQVLLAAGMDQTISLFQVDGEHNAKIQSVFLENYPIHTAHFTADGQQVIAGSRHKSFYYYDMIAGKVVNVPWIKGLEEIGMKRFEVSPDGRFLAFLGRYGRIHLLSAQSKEWISTLKMNGDVEAVAFTRDGSRMLSHGSDSEVYVWDMQTRDCVHRFVDEGCIQGTSLAVAHNDRYIATGSRSGVVNIYDTSCLTVREPRPLKAVMNLTTPATCLRFNASSEILAMASDCAEKAVKMVHLPSFTTFSNFPDRTDYNMRVPYCLDFSLNSGYFTIGNHKGNALLYRVKHYGNY